MLCLIASIHAQNLFSLLHRTPEPIDQQLPRSSTQTQTALGALWKYFAFVLCTLSVCLSTDLTICNVFKCSMC